MGLLDSYTGTGGKSYSTITADPYGIGTGGGGGLPDAPDESEDAGKGSFSFADPLGSIGETIGNAGEFLSGIGQIGIPGGPNLGGVVGAITAPARFGLEVAGNALGAVGSIPIPYLGNDPTRTNATLGQVPGLLGDAISAPARFVEEQAAKGRLTGNDAGPDILAEVGRHFFGSQTDRVRGMIAKLTEAGEPVPPALAAELARLEAQNAAALPPDIQERLDAGEDVDALAREMTERGVGFNNDPSANLAAGLVLDPLNLLAPGASKFAKAAKEASFALAAGETLGVGQVFMAKAYAAASRGMTAGGAAFMDRAIGPVTSGVFHALGTKPYNAVKNAVSGLNPAYGQAFVESFAVGAAQMPRAVIARYLSEDASMALRSAARRAAQAGEDVVSATKRALGAQTDDIEGSIQARLGAQRRVGADELERRSEELLRRTAPDFLGHSDEARFIESRDRLAQITGMSVEDAARALGGKADLRTAQTIHLAFYGKAGDDLARAKALAAGAKNIDVERLTLIGADTLTHERALDILSGKLDVVSSVDQFSILRNKFGNTAFDHAKVTAYVQKLVDEDALSRAALSPIAGKNKLPPALKAWQRQYEKSGYNIGFAPKDGWKTIVDEDGTIHVADPFVHFTSEADPVTMRNPLGRFMDSLFRGTTQTTIIAQSRARMVKITRAGGISPSEARAVHQKILQTAADESVSPRGLSLRGPHVYEDIFREVLGKERYDEFVKHVEPNYAVMWAFKGEKGTVGLTQALTGSVKVAFSGRGNVAAAIAEGIYPAVRFRLSPLFQAQELIESPFLNLMRGVRKRAVTEDMKALYDDFADIPDFKYLAEAGWTLNISGGTEVARTMTAQNTRLGRALSRFPNVKAFKERQRVAQVFHEHGEAFEEAVNAINPKLWRTMTEAYGTRDARVIADRFIQERMAMASGNLDEAMAVFDSAKSSFGHAIQSAYDAGDVAAGQALNVKAGVARGGNGAGGAMKLTDAELAKLGAEPLQEARAAFEDVGVGTGLERWAGVSVPRTGQPRSIAKYEGTVPVIGTRSVSYVARDGEGRIAGYAAFALDQGGSVEHIINVGVREDVQRRGLASALYRAAEQDGLDVRSVTGKGGVTDAGSAFSAAYLSRQKVPVDLGAVFPADRSPRSHDMETVWQAFRESFRQTSEQAFKTHYFNPKRGFFERTINHPYLGIYPASYMWGKVLPEFARFLLKRPFGLNAPLVGLAAYQRVQQSVVAALATDQELNDWVEKSSKEGVLYLIAQLLPGTPENLPANAPAWARHLSNDLTDLKDNPRYKSGPRKGQPKQFDPQAFATREASDMAEYSIGYVRSGKVALGALGDLGDLTGDLFADLTRSASQLDVQYPRVGVPQP